MKQLELKDISRETKIAVREKWNSMYHTGIWGPDSWNRCAMCEEMGKIKIERNIGYPTCDICPLSVNNWCGDGELSRLNRYSHNSKESWLKDIKEFLDWLDEDMNQNTEVSKMQAIIDTDKVIVKGKPMRKIIGFTDVLKEEALPEEYVKGALMFLLEGASTLHVHVPAEPDPIPSKTSGTLGSGEERYREINVRIGDTWSDEDFQTLMVWLKRAGERLVKINKKIKELQKDWNGSESFPI